MDFRESESDRRVRSDSKSKERNRPKSRNFDWNKEQPTGEVEEGHNEGQLHRSPLRIQFVKVKIRKSGQHKDTDQAWRARRGSPEHKFAHENRGGTPGFLSNSLLTDTTKNLSQHEYHSNKYGDDPQLRGSLRNVSRSLNRLSGNLRKSLVDDDSNLRTSHVTRSYTQGELNEALRDGLNKNPPPAALLSRCDWYTKPIHLTSSVNIPMSSEEMLAQRYFPVTLGESKSLEMVDEIQPGRGRSKSRSKTAGSRPRSKSARSQRERSRDDMKLMNSSYFLTAVAPHIKTAGITFTSPYSDELSKLRMEKLRIEEQQYLELKRQAELERIRGPKPKWYELKTPEFHREANKNNELLRNSDQWDDLLRYRESLINATSRLRTALQDYEVPVY